MQNPVYPWSLPIISEPYRDAQGKETWPRLTSTLTGRGRRIATLSAYPQTKSRKHQGCAKQPYHRKDGSGPALRDGICEIPDNAQRCGPRKTRCPEFVQNCANGQNEIERGRYPDPILRSRAATGDGRQSPCHTTDDGGIQEVNVKVVQRTRDVLMHGLFLRGYDCSYSLAPRFWRAFKSFSVMVPVSSRFETST